MRPYLTVLLDSFHEAFASRVLYILLLVLTVVLGGLAPLGYTEQRTPKFYVRNIHDWPAFINTLRQQAASDTPSPGKRIVELGEESLVEIIKENSPATEVRFDQVHEIVDGLNTLMTNSALYDESAWKGVRLREATQKLLEQGPATLKQDDLVYLNRLLLHDAYPANFDAIGDKELYLTYAWWTTPEPIPGGKTWFPQIVKASLAAFMDLFVGSIAIFVAILVTASMIPRTFEAGAIDLLLSKPISRSLLVLAKYVGGCVFILLSAGYFIVGLWLIVGLRMNVWSEKLLLCIPIFMFQFAIYYAVSMLAGVIWRNAIVSIVITILFFLSCFTVGTAKLAIEQAFINPTQLVRIVPANNGIVCVTKMGLFVQWNQEQQAWDEALQSSGRRPGPPMGPGMPSKVIGPIYHSPTQSLVYLKQSSLGGPQRFLGPGSEFVTAKWSGNWIADNGPSPPAGTAWIGQDAQDNILLVGSAGVFRYAPTEGSSQPKTRILGFEIPLGAGNSPFNRVGPEGDASFKAPFAAAIDPQSQRLLVDDQQALTLLARADETLQYTVQKSVNHEPAGPTQVGLTKNLVIVADKTGQVQLRNVASLQTERSFRPAGKSAPLAIATSEDGRFIAILFQNGLLWVYDDQSHAGRILDRDSTAIIFEGNDLILVDSMRQARVRDLKADKTTKVYAPKSDTLRWYYRWLIKPVYTIFPKPGELSNVIRNMLDESPQTTPQDDGNEDLRAERVTRDTTAPVVHGAIFVLIMLGLTCVYVERLDL